MTVKVGELLETLDGRLALELVTPTAPITIRRSDDEEAFSLLMPVRLDD